MNAHLLTVNKNAFIWTFSMAWACFNAGELTPCIGLCGFPTTHQRQNTNPQAGGSASKEVKTVAWTRKGLASVFWDSQGVLLRLIKKR